MGIHVVDIVRAFLGIPRHAQNGHARRWTLIPTMEGPFLPGLFIN